MTGQIVEPVVKIPAQIEQGDSVTWIDEPFLDAEGSSYDATGYTLTYTLAGATAPLSVSGTAQGTGWLVALTTAQTAALTPGTYWWQAVLTATSFQRTVARGELSVIANLASQSSGYSGLSAAEQNLASWKAALAALSGVSGPPVELYRIGDREMRYRNIPEVRAAIAYWQAEVINEQTQNSIAQNQGNPRKLYARFPSRFGTMS